MISLDFFTFLLNSSAFLLISVDSFISSEFFNISSDSFTFHYVSFDFVNTSSDIFSETVSGACNWSPNRIRCTYLVAKTCLLHVTGCQSVSDARITRVRESVRQSSGPRSLARVFGGGRVGSTERHWSSEMCGWNLCSKGHIFWATYIERHT